MGHITTSEDRHQLRAMIRRHEGVRIYPYLDSVGKLTIGVGRNLSDRGLHPEEIDLLYETDIKLAEDILDGLFDNWRHFPRPVRHGLVSMAYNLGGPRLAGFEKMRAALRAGDFATAATEARDSRWARQLPSRAKEISALFEEAARQGYKGP